VALRALVLPRIATAREYVAAYAIQIAVASGFAAMAVVAPFATAPRYPAVWPFLFALASALSLVTIARPEARTIVAATGSLVAMVGVARVIAIAEWYWPLSTEPRVLLHLALWGLHIVVGIKWPQITHDALLRRVVEETRRNGDPPDLRLDG